MKSVVILEYYVGETLNQFIFDNLRTCNKFIKLRNLNEEKANKYIYNLLTESDL